MKLQSALSAVLFATVAALSMGAHAADADKAAPAAEMKADQAAKPHSHVQEKTGMAQHMPAASDEKSGKPKAGKDKSKHLHPRDAK